MPDDAEIARRALDFQARGKDYRVVDLPGYMEWSKRKLAEGESPEYIANMDAGEMWLLPEDAARMTEADYDEFLEDTKAGLMAQNPKEPRVT